MIKVPKTLLASLAVLALGVHVLAEVNPSVIRAGSELDFRPYCFTDKDGQPMGFGVELLKAVANKMGLSLRITPGPWDDLWNDLVAGRIDVLPVVARTPGREPLVDFGLPHTETFDAFFVRKGQPPIKDIASADGKQIVVLRSDAAHHQLLERKFSGKVIPVESIPDGLRLVASGQHDAFLCSKLIGVLELKQSGIRGVEAGPPIPDYKRVFSFAVRKGNSELLEKLNQGLLIVKSDGTYDRIYQRWLAVEDPWRKWVPYIKWLAACLVVLVVLVLVLQGLVRGRTRELSRANAEIEAELVKRRQAEADLQQLNMTLEQRVAERTEALRESEDKYRNLFKNMAEEVHFWKLVRDESGQIRTWRLVDANPPTLKTWGKSLEEIVGKTTDEIFGPGAAEHYMPVVKKIMTEDVSHTYEDYFPNIDKYFRFTSVPLGDYFITTGADITGIKKAGEALKNSEALLKAVLDTIPDAVVLKDTESRVVMANPATLDVIGKPMDEVLGKNDMDHYDNPEVGRAIIENDRRIMESGIAEIVEETSLTPNGYRTYQCHKAPWRDKDGNVIGLLGVDRDITEQKKAEEALKKAFKELDVRAEELEAMNEELAVANEEVMASNEEMRTINEKLHYEIEHRRNAEAEVKAAYEHERRISKVLQKAIVPPEPSVGEGYKIAAAYVPIYEGEEVGGDFYDVFRLEDGRVGILIGDVSGKGVEAASHGAITRSTVRALAYTSTSSAKVLANANEVLNSPDVFGSFVTAHFAILEPATGEVIYSSAGHPPAALLRINGRLEFTDVGSLPLGITGKHTYEEGRFCLEPGDELILYTDGVTEARSRAGLFGTEGVERVLQQHVGDDPGGICRSLLESAREWAEGKLRDDTAIIVIQRMP